MLKYFLTFFILSLSIHAKPFLTSKKTDAAIIKSYLKKHVEFSSKVCPSYVEPRFWNLYKKFNSGGYYTPIDYQDKIDTKVVEFHLKMIINKEKWIKSEIEKLQAIKSIKPYFSEIEDLQNMIGNLLDIKERYFDENNLSKKDQVIRNSRLYYQEFQNKFRKFLEKITFLHTFNFPINHLELRRKYDSLKYKEDKVGKSEANMIYFVRKIYEDGAQDRNHTRSDMFLRTSINALYLKLGKENDFLTEDIRSDTVYVLKKVKSQLKRGKRKLLERLEEWQRRTAGGYVFYSSLLKNDEEGQKLREMISLEKANSRKNLKEYSLIKQAETYEFWTKQSKLDRMLYVLTTILFNEVGRIDGKDALERKDVLQVALNRTEIPFYNSMTEKDDILEYLVNRGIKNYNDFPWLNVLFKEGEFSFTYFFIHGNIRIFCPSRTKTSRFLRKENLNLALRALRRPNKDFAGLRYFSRNGMLGRIDMSSLWRDYLPIAERPGKKVINSKRLLGPYKRKRYEYFYHFTDPYGTVYKVIKIHKKKYAYNTTSKTFYKYRNIHNFKYFKKGPENNHVE